MNNKILKHPALPALEDQEDLTCFCKATADSLRLQILRVLRADSLGVLEMCKIFDIRQSAMSHHLKILTTAGLLSTRRESNSIFYRRSLLKTDDPLFDMKSSLFKTLDRVKLPESLLERLCLVQAEREQQALGFFTKLAGLSGKFKKKQNLLADSRQYGEGLKDILQGIQLPEDATVMEVGPGEGELLVALAQMFHRIIALDKSEEMLNKSRQALKRKALDNVSFVLGDNKSALSLKRKVDLVIYSMVLHHIPSAPDVFKDSSTLLEEGGVILIVDLCRHNQQWVKETCGDIWLGFEPEELTAWAREAGFVSGQSLYLGLKNGFQIQMRLFKKSVGELDSQVFQP